MRNPQRIPIVLKNIPWVRFFKEYKVKNPIKSAKLVKDNITIIKKYWQTNPDLRLGQLLINFHYIEDGSIGNVEEVDWLVDNKTVKLEEICFWGSRYDKDMNRLPEIKYKLLKNLEDSHIAAILDFNTVINQDYRKYFMKRLNIKDE